MKIFLDKLPLTHVFWNRLACIRQICGNRVVPISSFFSPNIDHSTNFICRATSAKTSKEVKGRPESLDFYKEEMIDMPAEEDSLNLQNFDNDDTKQLREQDFKSESEVDNNLNDNIVEVDCMQALDIHDENSQEKTENENGPDTESKDNEGRLSTGHLDLKFYHSPLW